MQGLIRFAFSFALVSFGCSKDEPVKPAAKPVAVDRRLTHAECAEGVDHAIALFEREPAMADAAKMMRDGRTDFIAQCERTATVRDHECLMKSKTSHELGLCPMPGTR